VQASNIEKWKIYKIISDRKTCLLREIY
jgi:hypothetical protein